jgi:hypothetical protein
LRQEDKQVDGPELEQAEERKRESELVEEKDDALYDLDGQPERTVDREKSSAVVVAMKAILAGDQIVINDLKLEKRHQVALEALKTAVEGKDQTLSRFVFAEDRRTLLEQALAVLQPELADISQLGQPFQDLLKDVGSLREKLNVLEDAEEELIEGRANDQAKTESDSDDKPDEDEAKDEFDVNTDLSLTGPPRVFDKPAGALAGPTRKVEPKPETTLTGTERKAEPKGPTTLGDPKDIAAAQRRRE